MASVAFPFSDVRLTERNSHNSLGYVRRTCTEGALLVSADLRAR
jgi:hypothetical protein